MQLSQLLLLFSLLFNIHLISPAMLNRRVYHTESVEICLLSIIITGYNYLSGSPNSFSEWTPQNNRIEDLRLLVNTGDYMGIMISQIYILIINLEIVLKNKSVQKISCYVRFHRFGLWFDLHFSASFFFYSSCTYLYMWHINAWCWQHTVVKGRSLYPVYLCVCVREESAWAAAGGRTQAVYGVTPFQASDSTIQLNDRWELSISQPFTFVQSGTHLKAALF